MRNNDPFSDLIRSIEENLQRSSAPPPGDDGNDQGGNGGGNDGQPGRQSGDVNLRQFFWVGIPLAIFLLYNTVVGFGANWVWYDSQALTPVLATRIVAGATLFFSVALTTWLVIALNIWLAGRLDPYAGNGVLDEFVAPFGLTAQRALLWAAAVFAVLQGVSAASHWNEMLLWLNRSPYGTVDPVFGEDVSFFFFTLPVWEIARGWLQAALAGSLLGVALMGGLTIQNLRIRTSLLVHSALLGALLLGTVAWQYRIDSFRLVYSQRGAVFGAGFTDVNAQLPVYNLLILLTVAAAVILIGAAALRRGWRTLGAVLVIWLVIAVGAGSVYPNFVQRFQVSPNELNLERPFIADNIKYTRLAYGLDDIENQRYAATGALTIDKINESPETVRNARLWDYRPLLQTYNQVQALRQYFAFNDVDVDRYVVDGQRRQVMISARELVPDRLNSEAQTWVNRKLVYTHGYGVAVSPVEEITRDGLPSFFVKDLPMQGVIPVSEPQIYFGELTEDYVIAATSEMEFDHPQGESNAMTRFTATTGIDMTLLNRLLFALRFADVNLVLNSDIQETSQLLWKRNIMERIREVAPFFTYDADPYIVIGDDGRLYWMADAYTTSDRFPYSEPFQGEFNYIRNPVKVVVNAYDGTMTFYLIEPDEPIAAAYSRIYPVLFQPFSAMPDFLKQHLRYPTDFFSVQADIYRTYHMTDPSIFYNKEDVWAWPEEVFFNETQRIEPYYVLMSLPGEDASVDYMQILPFTPANRENMVAWMAAHSDPEKYGETVVYEFGREALLFGPKQVEARIDQDPLISAQLSLWNQQGSSVIRGNLLVLPIADSLLYVEPLYLQSSSGKIPELKRVILATTDRVVMAENLGLALVELFGRNAVAQSGLGDLLAGSTVSTSGSETTGAPTMAEGVSLNELIVEANRRYEAGQEALRNGDWAAYGAEMAALQQLLTRLATESGVTLPPAAPAEEAAPAATPESAPAPEG
jgi:uncharacterized membrane protein (UPF0182 family)